MSPLVNTGDTQTRSSECTFERLKKKHKPSTGTPKGINPGPKKFRLWCRWHVYDISLIARRVHLTLFTLLLVSMDRLIANDQETAMDLLMDHLTAMDHLTLFTLLLVSMDRLIANDQETASSK